ncbi:MAG: FtsQ-type POTRA domain-containing protein [bacterium]|nr:FtsQ-type POTRA domain-containing protein [bacterium]
MSKAKKKKKKRKLNKKRVLTFLIILLLIGFLIYYIINIKIKNIYISGNIYLTDQQVIDIADITDYPKSLNNLSASIKKRLNNDTFILNSKVYKTNFLSSIHIKIEENYPLFYYQVKNKTVLYNKDEVDFNGLIPTVLNQIPDTIYNKFIEKMRKLDLNILNRISEIEYKPNEVDEERFLLFMNDGNYVYLTLYKFTSINKYIDMLKSFDNKKGILHLDSGKYFEVIE